MKKLLVLAIMVLAITSFAAAGGLVFHLGAGYHSSYVGDLPNNTDAGYDILQSMPLGVGGYVGLGYGFGERKVVSLGAEFAPSWALALDPLGASNFTFQGRAFLKFKPVNMLTVTAFGGYSGEVLSGVVDTGFENFGAPILGARITALFLYAEYGAVILPDFSGIAKHEIGLGVAIFK